MSSLKEESGLFLVYFSSNGISSYVCSHSPAAGVEGVSPERVVGTEGARGKVKE